MQKDLERNRQLRKDGVISAIDLEEKEKVLIQYRRQLENLPASMLQNNIRIEQLTAQQLQLRQQWTDDKTARLHALRQQIQALQGAITTWEQQFVLRAPAAGQLAFAPGLAAKNPVQAGSILFTVVPEHKTDPTLARSQVTTSGIGKIGKGTPLQIALDAYPEKEYGVLNTEVADIALIPVTDKEGQFHYEVTALLPDTLTTSYGKTIPLRQRMSGIATLITEDKSILERIFENFLDIVKNR